jgi:D-glycero-D-manno-heptose 1,7-bisphosphate phosphatase
MLDLKHSWMIGDQDSDVYCGQSAGLKTILINNEHSGKKRGKSSPDYKVNSIEEAVNIISKNNSEE